MTSSTFSVLRTVLSAILGLAMAGFGLLRSITSYPGGDAFTRFAAALPTVTAVASFALAVIAAIAGFLLLLPVFLRLRRRRQQAVRPRSDYGPRVVSQRPLPPGYDPEYDGDPDGRGPDDLFAGTASGYGRAYGDHRRQNNGDLDRGWNPSRH